MQVAHIGSLDDKDILLADISDRVTALFIYSAKKPIIKKLDYKIITVCNPICQAENQVNM
jgi:hypothetical protein